jgi:glyoxylase-like metal-dependent hydrolase (beta-lactamase superfamily II)
MLSTAEAQRPIDFDKIEIQTTKVANDLYVLVGEGGNILVSAGSDGILLVDAQYAPLHQKIMDAIRKISPQPIRFLINTHFHTDHTGGNEAMAKAGAVIIAHENVWKRLSAGQPNANNPAQSIPPAPKEALPVVTYSDSLTLHFNGDEIYIYHPAPAHTDGDSVVHFRRANLIHVGDLLSSIRYPRIDANNGSVDGTIAEADHLLKIANADTKIIPGHIGTVASVKEVQQQREMLVTVRDRILNGMRSGKTIEQIIASKPTAEFDEARKGSLAPDEFVKLVYQTLSRSGQQRP